MRFALILAAAGSLAMAFAGGAAAERPAGADSDSDAPGDRLGAAIERAIKGEGPFFTPEERALVEARCGYAPGSWDGFEANTRNGTFVCRDGRRIDDAEMRAMLAVAGPRIERRVRAAMQREDVQGAIRAVAEQAQRQALQAVDQAKVARIAAREATAEARRAMDDAGRR
jgi:hypothetical protein